MISVPSRGNATRSRARLAALLVAGCLSGWLAGGSSAVAQSSEQDAFIAKGQKLASERCGRCHAVTETDHSAHPKAPPFRLVVERYPSENLAEALAEGIVAGHPDMPVIVLQPDEIEAFLAYLDSFGPDAKGARGAKLKRGA